MAYFSTEPASQRRNINGKKRVWDFFPLSSKTHPANRRQPAQPRRKIDPTATKAASGIPCWPSRDPIAENGGLNLYGFEGNDGVDNVDILGSVPLKTLTYDQMWDLYEKWNPQRDKTKDQDRKNTLKKGCVGISALLCGDPGWPKIGLCFKTRQEALTKSAAMKTRGDCCKSGEKEANGGSAEPRLFSVHMPDRGKTFELKDQARVDTDTKTKPVDMENWADTRPKNEAFDFGYQRPDGTMIHANHFQPEPGQKGSDGKPMGGMTAKFETLDNWQNLAGPGHTLYQIQVWCVDCNDDRFRANEPERKANGELVSKP